MAALAAEVNVLKTPAASGGFFIAQKSMRKLCLIFVLLALSLHLHATGPNTTIVQDVVYRADGSAAHGSLVISWPGFTTAAGYAVAAGQMNLAIGSGGAISLALIPNKGAAPAGT